MFGNVFFMIITFKKNILPLPNKIIKNDWLDKFQFLNIFLKKNRFTVDYEQMIELHLTAVVVVAAVLMFEAIKKYLLKRPQKNFFFFLTAKNCTVVCCFHCV